MLQIFSGPGQIYALIDEYAEWKFGIHPYQAGQYRSLLIRFAKTCKIRDVEEITEDHLAYFIGHELSEFYQKKAEKAFRSFLTFASGAGYDCIPHSAVKSLQYHEAERMVLERPRWRLAAIPKWKRN
ncbi:hypothetical protein C4568_03700 [Candidatus Parcubacteria bacterium]|nr:MAG: hypothetical protein C4568_03700 [Candidatus Parcubacteria bacterium]